MFDLVEDLEYLLEWPLSADDIASHLGVRDAAGVEKRFDRYNIIETEIAERFRRRKPGYCPECRQSAWIHRAACSSFIPNRDHEYQVRRRLRVSA
jgi:hypothetical protein